MYLMMEQRGFAGGFDGFNLGYERKIGVKDDFIYFDLSNWEELFFIEMEKEQLWGLIGYLMGDIKQVVICVSLKLKEEVLEGDIYLSIISMLFVFFFNKLGYCCIISVQNIVQYIVCV